MITLVKKDGFEYTVKPKRVVISKNGSIGIYYDIAINTDNHYLLGKGRIYNKDEFFLRAYPKDGWRYDSHSGGIELSEEAFSYMWNLHTDFIEFYINEFHRIQEFILNKYSDKVKLLKDSFGGSKPRKYFLIKELNTEDVFPNGVNHNQTEIENDVLMFNKQ